MIEKHRILTPVSQRGLVSLKPFIYKENDELQVELEAKADEADAFDQMSLSQFRRRISNYVGIKDQDYDFQSSKTNTRAQVIPLQFYGDYVDDINQSTMKSTNPRSKLAQKSQLTFNQFMLYINKQKFISKLLINLRKPRRLSFLHLDLIQDKASDKYKIFKDLSFIFKSQAHKTKHKQSSRLLQLMMKNTKVIPQKNVLHKLSQIKQDIFNSFITITRRLILKFPTISPEDNIKLAWDSASSLMRIIFFLIIPIDIAYSTKLLNELTTLTFFMIVVIFIDILIRVSTICYESGAPVKDRWLIFKIQIKKTFFKDFMAISSLLLSFILKTQQISTYLVLVFFFQYEYLGQTLEKLEDRYLLSKIAQSMWTLIKLIVTLVYILHVFSCFWFLISSHTSSPNWIESKQLLHSPWSLQYLESFYFSTVTMLTIGYGDNVPINYSEKIVAIFFMLAACIWLSYSVNVVGSIVNEFKSQKDQIALKIRVLNKYLQNKNISFSLRYRIKEYLIYLWEKKTESELVQQEQIIDDLSSDLKSALCIEANRAFFKNSKFFTQNFTQELLNSLILKIRTKVFFPNTYFDTKLESSEYNLCFVDLGQVQILPSNPQLQFSVTKPFVTQGKYIGLKEFFVDGEESQKMCFKSDGFVSILYITKSEFMQILKEYPNDEEQFQFMKQRIIFGEGYEILEIKCPSCSQVHHEYFKCPLISPPVDYEQTIKSYTFEIHQSRQVTRRKQEKSTEARPNKYLIQEIAIQFQENNKDLILAQLILQLDQNEFENSIRTEDDSPKRDGLIPFNPKFLMPDYFEESVQEEKQIEYTPNPLRLVIKKSIDGLWLKHPNNNDYNGRSPEFQNQNPRTSTDGIQERKQISQRVQSQRNFVNFQFYKSQKKLSFIKIQNSHHSRKFIHTIDENYLLSINKQFINKFNRHMQENSENLLEKLKKHNYQCQSLELIVLKHRNLFDSEGEDIKNFEILRDYKIFYPEGNSSKLFNKAHRLRLFYDEKSKTSQILRTLRSFMFYPWLYFTKYPRQDEAAQKKQQGEVDALKNSQLEQSPSRPRKISTRQGGINLPNYISRLMVRSKIEKGRTNET